MSAEKTLTEIKLLVDKELSLNERSSASCKTQSDFVLFGRVNLAREVGNIIEKYQAEFEEDVKTAMAELEDELLNQASGRFCINGNCEE